MLNRKLLIVAIVALLALAALPAVTAPAAAPPLQEGAPAAGAAGMQFTQFAVESKGVSAKIKEGAITTDMFVRAVAMAPAKDGTLASAHFLLKLTAFQPAQDMPGQKAGRWYVMGLWTLNSQEQPEAQSLVSKRNPHAATGYFKAVLSFNPAENPDKFIQMLNTTEWAPERNAPLKGNVATRMVMTMTDPAFASEKAGN
jgi:hypothetical protein